MLLMAVDNNNFVAIAFIDLNKAFDLIDHPCCVPNCQLMALTVFPYSSFMITYLSDCKQRVILDNMHLL